MFLLLFYFVFVTLNTCIYAYIVYHVFLFPIFRVIQSIHTCTRSPLYKVFLLLIFIVCGHILFQSNMLIGRQHEMFAVNTSDIDYIVNTARRMDVTQFIEYIRKYSEYKNYELKHAWTQKKTLRKTKEQHKT
jgi:hypothetical protein